MLVVVAGLVPASATVRAQDGLNMRIIQSGHSLTDPIVGPLRAMAIASGASPDIIVHGSTIPGSPMDWRWNNAPAPGKPNAKTDIGNYDLLVLTERVSLSNTMPWHNSTTEALRWFENAHRNGAGGEGARTALYAGWVTLESGPEAENPYNDPEGSIPWRERLPREFARWMEIADFVNANRPEGAPEMRVIPATLVMAAAYDDIMAGRAPELTDITSLFGDDIHLNDAGAYLIALTHFAVIYGLDPRGLPNDIGLARPISPAQAEWMQSLVWEVVSTFQALEARRALPGAALTAEAFQSCLWPNPRQLTASCP